MCTTGSHGAKAVHYISGLFLSNMVNGLTLGQNPGCRCGTCPASCCCRG